jgi:hypothetical protein
MTATYPDISDILARKADARREAAARTFVEKIGRIELLRDRLQAFAAARNARKAARQD